MSSLKNGLIGATIIGVATGVIGACVGVPAWASAVVGGLLAAIFAEDIGGYVVKFFGGKNGQN